MQKQRPRMVWFLTVGITVALLVAVIGYAVFNATKPQPGTKTPDDGREHFNTLGYGHVPISQTKLKPYSTDPPTSGPHWDVWVQKGIYDTPQSDEMLVHSLEHGYIVIDMSCTQQACPDLYNQLKSLVLSYDKKVILNYRPQTKTPVAVAAWTRLLTFAESELAKNSVGGLVLTQEQQAAIMKFVDAYRDKGPEAGAL